ncbi:MAG: SPFH domain-containing protein [bacterium]|nr:SPFH domain-containing protein [bacterium]
MTNVYVALGFLVLWTIIFAYASIVLVKTGSIAVVFRFRAFKRVLEPRTFPHFIIPIIDTIERYSTQTHQEELPAEADNIDRVNDIPSPGKKLPFRVLMKGKGEAIFYVKKAESDATIIRTDPLTAWNQVHFQDLNEPRRKALEEDSLHAPLTGEIAVVVEWYLKGDDEYSIKDFVQNVIPEGGRNREEEIRKRIEDMASRTLQELLGPVTLGHAQEMMSLFSLLIKERTEILVGEKGEGSRPWGIHIRDAYIKSIHPGRRVNEARADAAAAVSQKQGTIRIAEGVAVATELQAEADKTREIKKGEGEAARINAMAAAMKDPDARFIAQLDVLETALPAANTVYVVPSDGGLFGNLLALGKEVVKNTKKEDKPEDKK